MSLNENQSSCQIFVSINSLISVITKVRERMKVTSPLVFFNLQTWKILRRKAIRKKGIVELQKTSATLLNHQQCKDTEFKTQTFPIKWSWQYVIRSVVIFFAADCCIRIDMEGNKEIAAFKSPPILRRTGKFLRNSPSVSAVFIELLYPRTENLQSIFIYSAVLSSLCAWTFKLMNFKIFS